MLRVLPWPNRFSQTQWTLFDQALVSGTNFLTNLLLARYLGLSEFGRFSLAWMVILFLNCVQLALVVSPMMSIGPKYEEGSASAYYSSVLVQQVCLTLGMAALLTLGLTVSGVAFATWKLATLVAPLVAVVIAFQLQEFVRRYFFTRGRAGLAFANDAVSYLGQLGLLVGLAHYTTLDSAEALWIVAVTSAIAASAGLLSIEWGRFGIRYFSEVMARHLMFSKWLLASSIMQWVGGNFFVGVSAAYLSASAAGAISAARNIVGPTQIMFMALENIVPLRASRVFKQHGEHALHAYIIRICVLGGVATAVICLTASGLAPYLLGWLFGPEYVQYTYLVFWFSITHFLMFFIRPLTSLLRAKEFTRPIATSSVLSMLLSLALSVPMIARFGLTGAMVVMLATQVVLLTYTSAVVLMQGKTIRERLGLL